MKKILITSLLFLFSFSYSQSFSCRTTGFIPHSSNFNRPSIPDPVDPDSTTPLVLNAYFTLFKDGNGHTVIDNWDGTGVSSVGTNEQVENRFLECIKILNIQFNQYHIYFKYTGFRVETTAAQTLANFSGDNWTAFDTYREPNAMNFYVLNTNFNSDTQNRAIGGTEVILPINNLVPQNSGFLYYSLVHSVAHNLSLYHTYEVGSHFLDIPGNEQIIAATQCERVNRIPNDNPNIYNADIAGDEVTDTEAQPLLSGSCSSGYAYDPNNQNCYQEPYSDDIIVGNFMSNSVFFYDCWDFSQGQITRMRNYIRNNTTNYGYLLGTDSARTDVAALYEPFDAQVIQGDIVSTEDQPDNGGAWVCRSQKLRLRFQPGFKQTFHGVTNGPITQIQDQQFNYDNSFDHGIGVEIPSISNNIIEGIGVISSITSLSCGFESYVSGTVYSTAVLGSMNITVKELNEIEAKDPELYNKLMEQYYYILKKITASGAKTEQTFYKQ